MTALFSQTPARFLQKRDGNFIALALIATRTITIAFAGKDRTGDAVEPKRANMMQSKERIYQRLGGFAGTIRMRWNVWKSGRPRFDGFSAPVPDYQPDERYMLPTSSDSGQTPKPVKGADREWRVVTSRSVTAKRLTFERAGAGRALSFAFREPLISREEGFSMSLCRLKSRHAAAFSRPFRGH